MSHLVNVRLDEERQRRVRVLRERGIALSDVVRDAIDERFEALRNRESPIDVQSLIRRVFEQFPDAANQPAREYNPHDRRAARQAIRRKLRREKP